MVVKIEGKEHRQGVSKAGKNYDFISLHFLARQNGVEGHAAVSKIVNTSVIPYENILVGQHYDLEVDFGGNVIGIKPVKV
jgi:hypothetical protein